MSKLSLKIGTYFLILALCIETIAFVSFYKSISKMRIEEETLALLEKGNRYSNKITQRAKWSTFAKERNTANALNTIKILSVLYTQNSISLMRLNT